MAGVSLPVLFGSLLAGAVVIDYGTRNVRSAWAATSPNATPTTPGGKDAAPPGRAGTVETLAAALAGAPYNVAGHAAAIDETIAQVHNLGTDCSGFVSDLMGPNGLGIWKAAYATPGIPSAPGMIAGQGSQITLWNNPNPGSAGHVFVQFILGNGQSRYFEEGGATGNAHEMNQGEVQQYLQSGAYQPYHPAGY